MDSCLDRGARFGPRAGPEESWPSFRSFLYDEASRGGHGSGDQPFDYRSSRGTALGESECAPRRRVSVDVADSGGSGVMSLVAAQLVSIRYLPFLRNGRQEKQRSLV